MPEFIKHSADAVDPDDPWRDDVLGRQELANHLTQVLSTITQPFVLGLHAEYGNGKTFFIERWKADLEKSGDVAIYFNAWATDYESSPLIGFTAAIAKQMRTRDRDVQGRIKPFTQAAARLLPGTLLRGANQLAYGIVPEGAVKKAAVLRRELAEGGEAAVVDKAYDVANNLNGRENDVKAFQR